MLWEIIFMLQFSMITFFFRIKYFNFYLFDFTCSLYLEEYKKFGNPFKTSQVPKLQTLIKNEAEKHEFNLSAKSLSIIARNRNIVTKTFNKAGLVVPYNKKYDNIIIESWECYC